MPCPRVQEGYTRYFSPVSGTSVKTHACRLNEEKVEVGRARQVLAAPKYLLSLCPFGTDGPSVKSKPEKRADS